MVVTGLVVMKEANGKMSNIVVLAIGQTTTDALVVTDREDMSTEDVLVPLATPGLNGETGNTVVQPLMVPGIIIVEVMRLGEKELFTTEVAQEAPAIITPQPKLSLSRTALQAPGSIIALAMTSGDKEPLALVLGEVVLAQPKTNSIRTVEKITVRAGAATTVKTMMSIVAERVTTEVVQEPLVLTIPIKMKRKFKSVVLVIGLTTTAVKVIGAKENG